MATKKHTKTGLFTLEFLESRKLLTGVTLITHGFEWSGSDDVAWMSQMAHDIANRAGSNTPIFNLVVNSSGGATITQIAGTSVDSNPDGNVVIELNWTALSNNLFYANTNTAYIASIVAPVFTSTFPTLGIDHPLGDLPIQLIGHSRGGSLMSALAEDLGKEGIWVDQMTTLDPHPVQSSLLINVPDPDPNVYSNVLFADNYYETVDTSLITGAYVDGAHNVDLSNVVDSLLPSYSHAYVHAFYDGTVNLSATTDGDGSGIPAYWYNTPTGPRNAIGFAYSLIGGATRPTDGIGQPFGGSGSRVAISGQTGTQWANVDSVHLTDTGSQFLTGQTLHAQFLFEDSSKAPTVTLSLDSNENPFDGSANYSAANVSFAAGNAVYHPTNAIALNTSGIPAGSYYIEAKITDGTTTRYAYSTSPIKLIAPGSIAGSIFNDVNGDGVKQSTEGALSGWTVVLNNGATATTNSAGQYTFNNLAPGGYTITETIKSGWLQTAPSTSSTSSTSVTVSSGKTSVGPTFGNTQRSFIVGTVFNDANGNKIQDPGEAGLANWHVTIQIGNGPVLLNLTTSSSGYFGFDVAAGTYVVKIVSMTGYTITTSTSLTITVGNGVISSHVFGAKKN